MKPHTKAYDQMQKELKMGTKRELEHTKSKKQAKKIAMDHIKEHPKYYSTLNKIFPEYLIRQV